MMGFRLHSSSYYYSEQSEGDDNTSYETSFVYFHVQRTI